MAKLRTILLVSLSFTVGLVGCGSGESDTGSGQTTRLTPQQLRLSEIISSQGLAVDPLNGRTVPDIKDPLPQLGKKLFFSKSLSGEQDTACASCHHPMLGGADGLSLAVGVNAVQPEVMGVGRVDDDQLPDVPRNSPTIFNMALWDSTLFWDSRVESLNKQAGMNGAGGGISTPDSGFNVADSLAGKQPCYSSSPLPHYLPF